MKFKVIENSGQRCIEYEREYKNKSSKYKGVRNKKNKGKTYEVRVCLHNKTYGLGVYRSEEVAAKVFDLFAKRYVKNPQLNETLYPDIKNIVIPEDDLLWVNSRLDQMEVWVHHGEKLASIRRIKPKLPKLKVKKVSTKKPTELELLLPKEVLIRLMKVLRLCDIAKQFGCKQSTLTYLLQKYNIKRTSHVERLVLKHGFTRESLIKDIEQGNNQVDLTKLYKLNSSDPDRLFSYFNIDWTQHYPRKLIKCLFCGKEVLDKQVRGDERSIKKYCSKTCNDKAYNVRASKRRFKEKAVTKVCVTCNKEFVTTISKKKCCSKECRLSANLSKKTYYCRTCHEILPPNVSRYCSNCREQRRNQGIKKVYDHVVYIQVSECKICHKLFKQYRKKTICSKKCEEINRKQKNEKWRANPENKKRMRLSANLYKRKVKSSTWRNKEVVVKEEMKAIRNGLKGKEPRKDLKLLQKRLDYFGKRICCYCNKQIPDTEYVTIDHLLPICKGGDNSLNNLYCACSECNQDKWYKDFLEWYRSKPFYSLEREEQIKLLNNPGWEQLLT
jgi:HNH endonuclease